ncbi:MAG: hypothetical protein HC774_01230 [Sphingomonadales bacterium]|nr:hypothetical protein [Sphingomonadales bacterium]
MLDKARQRDATNRAFEEDIKRFGEIILKEPGLVQALDTATSKDAFMDMYIRLAKERGINIMKEHLLIAVQEQKQGSNWIIPKPVLRLIADRF